MLESSQIWWREITGPKAFITEVTSHLLGASVIVRVPDDLPWRHEMRREIERELREQLDFEEISIIQIDAEEDVPADVNVDTYILERFALGEVARQYRKKSGKTISQFIIEKQVLKDDVLWIKGFDEMTLEKWLSFFRSFSACNPTRGRIVLEVRDDIVCRIPNAVREINYSSYISGYNLQLFCSILLDRSNDWPETWKQYISALAAHICVTDAEIAECFICGLDHSCPDPIGVLSAIANDEEYLRRGSGSGSVHILALVRSDNTSMIQSRIWEAQLQALFPILETRRVQLIERIKTEITDLLRKREIRQFGDRVENPYEMEWGTLYYAMKLRNIDDCYYLSSLTDSDRKMIRFHRDCRNTLAHGDRCTAAQVRGIIDGLI